MGEQVDRHSGFWREVGSLTALGRYAVWNALEGILPPHALHFMVLGYILPGFAIAC